MVTFLAARLTLVLSLALALPLGAAQDRAEVDVPEPDSLAELTARVCGLVERSAELAAAATAFAEPGQRGEPRQRLARRLAVLAQEIDRVCRLYSTEGEKLFLGQEISSIYRRRRAVERCLAREPLPAELEPAWSKLQPALVRLHQAVNWREFDAWYLEKDGDGD